MLYLIFLTCNSGRSRQASQKAIDTLLTSRKQRDVLERRIRKIEDQFAAGRGDSNLHVDLQLLQDQFDKIEAKIAERETQLGRVSNYQLLLVRNNKFFELRMAARVLKTRLRARIIQRKMEFARIERPLRTQANGTSYLDEFMPSGLMLSFADRRLEGHMLSTINRREPTIRALAREYNKCCEGIAAVIAKREAPRGSRAPPQVDVDRLFALDVDEDIWQDLGLEEEENEPAPWQTDPKVREGIRHMQELDRCKEEQARLAHERASLQEWIADEWNALESAIAVGGT